MVLTYGCPFNDGEGMIRFLKGNVKRKRDTMFVGEGPEGSGKSTTTQQISRRLKPGFDPEADAIFTLRHLLDELEDAREGQVHLIDEAVNIFHNQDWATWEAKQLTKLIRQMRIMRCTWILNIPDYEGLHPYLRDYRVRLRLYHQPLFDRDGMLHGPPKTLWKSERFDFKEQRVTSYWRMLDYDLRIESMDDDPSHAAYEERKKQNFRDMVRTLRDRIDSDDKKAAKTKAKRNGSARKRKPASPPTTT